MDTLTIGIYRQRIFTIHNAGLTGYLTRTRTHHEGILSRVTEDGEGNLEVLHSRIPTDSVLHQRNLRKGTEEEEGTNTKEEIREVPEIAPLLPRRRPPTGDRREVEEKAEERRVTMLRMERVSIQKQ